MKMYGGVEVWFHTFFTSVLDWGEWSVSYWLLYPWERSP